jgi:hypothetical protein
MSEHKRFSPSALHRTMACTASVQFIEGLPQKLVDRTDSIYARRGTAGHTTSEMVLNNTSFDSGHKEETAPLDTFLGQTIDDIIIDEEIIAACKPYVEHCQSLMKKALFYQAENKLDLSRWKKLKLSAVNGAECGGTMDFIAIYPHKEHIILDITDLKTGSGVAVEVEHNPQLLCYALCALLKFHRQYKITRIKITIVQQPVHHKDGPVRSWIRTPRQLVHWGENELLPALEEMVSDNPVFAPSEETCQWCPGRAQCSARYEHACSNALAEFTDAIEVDEQGAKHEITVIDLPVASRLTDEQKQNILEHGDEIIAFIQDIKAAAHIQAERGFHVPGFKLVRKRTNRVYKGEQPRVRKALDRLGLHAADYMNPPTMKSPAQVETLLSAKGIALDKQRKFLENFVEQPEGGTNLVPESHPGKPVQPAVEEEFADLIDSDDEDLLAF